MSFVWMRRVDSLVGKPLLRCLSFFTKKAKSLRGDEWLKNPPKCVICAKFIGLGSVVLSLPLLRALKDSGVRIAFMSFPGQAELLKLSGLADEVWVVRPSLAHFLPSLWKAWWASRKFKAQAFLDLEPTANFTAILARLSGAPIRIGFMSAKPLRESLFTHLVSLSPERHMARNSLRMAECLGITTAPIVKLPPPPESAIRLPATVVMRSATLAKRKAVVINVNASDLSWHRMWPDDSWVALCNELLKDTAVDLYFPGSGAERERVSRLVRKIGSGERVFNIAGQTSLLELLRILRNAYSVITVDSGIMHLAAWTETPVVGIFGPETPRLYGPVSSRSKVIWAGLPCSPCLIVAVDKITRCRDNQCMKSIQSEKVFHAYYSLTESCYGRRIDAPKEAA